jgi:bacterioferritin-associated ferredoxin
MIVCVCHNISESEIKAAIKSGLDDMHLLRENLGIGSCCGKCKSCTKKILRECVPHEDRKKSHHVIHFQQFAA